MIRSNFQVRYLWRHWCDTVSPSRRLLTWRVLARYAAEYVSRNSEARAPSTSQAAAIRQTLSSGEDLSASAATSTKTVGQANSLTNIIREIHSMTDDR